MKSGYNSFSFGNIFNIPKEKKWLEVCNTDLKLKLLTHTVTDV